MIDGSEKRNRRLAFDFQNSHVYEKRSNEDMYTPLARLPQNAPYLPPISRCFKFLLRPL